MRSAPSSGIFLAADETRTGDIGEGRYLAVAECHVDMLPSASLHAGQKSRHDRVGGVQTGGKVSHCDADFDWWAVSFASDVHETKFAFKC
jgi:hypothetical protein